MASFSTLEIRVRDQNEQIRDLIKLSKHRATEIALLKAKIKEIKSGLAKLLTEV